MPTEDKLLRLYNNVQKDFSLPDYETFKTDMADPEKRQRLYNNVGTKYSLPDYETFSADMGFATQPQQQEAGLDTFIPPVIASRDPLNPNENSSFNPPPTAPEAPTPEPPQEVTVTRKQRDAIVGSALKVPKDIRSNSVFGTRYVKDVSKRTGIPEQAVKQLYEQGVKNEDAYVEIKTQYDITPEDSPDKNQQLNVMGQLLLDLGRYDEAAQAYKQLETRLYKEGLQELKPGMRPDYLDQKQAPAFIGLMNAVYSKGDMKEYERMLKIAEMKGIDLSGQPSVGDGSYMQPSTDLTSTFGFSGRKGRDSEPTPESQYLNEIANTVERLTPGVNTMKMMGHGIDKVAKNQWEFNNYGEYQLNMITGLVEAAGAVAMMASPEGAVAGVPFEQLPNYIPESASEYMMPVSKVVREIYDGKPPATAENLSVLGDFALMALVAGGAHGVKNAQGKRIARGEVGKELIKNIESLPPEELRAMFEQAEKRFEATGSDPVLYAEQVKERATQVASKLKEVEESLPMEPYNPEPAPESLRTVKEGVDVEFEGKIGKLDRGDDGAWYFVDEEGKSTQIPVEDKFNPTEKLSELGIQVLPEISKESVARAVADREQVGDVEYKDKKYFVSLDNPMSESPTGDLVFERSADGRLLNRFDSHPDPAFALSRKLAIINKYLADKGLPPRKKLIEPWKEKSAPVSTEKTSEGAVTPKEVVEEVKPKVEEIEVKAPEIEVVEEPKVEEAKVEEPIVESKEKVDRNTILDLKDKWNSIPKKDRAVVGVNLRAKIDAQAKELGFEIVQDKGGKIKVVQKGGKAVNRSPVKLTEEQRAEAKARAEQIKRVKNQMPVDLRQAILQYFLRGGRGIKMTDVTRVTGFKSANDFAPFTVSQDGRSMHKVWEEMRGDSEIAHLIDEDNSVFEDKFLGILTEYADRESMWRDLLDYDAESNWREQGFTSQHQYESYLFSKMEAAKEGLAPDALTQDMFEQAMAEVEAMPDEAVETLLRELDEVSPKTQEELNNFYNENNIEKAESSAKEGTTDSQVSGAKGEDLNEVRKQVIEEEAQAVSEKELKKAQEDYLKAKEEFDRKAKEVDERIADSQQQEIFAQEKPENPLDVEIDVSKRGKAVEESKVKLDQAKQKLSDLQGRREKAKAEAMKKIDDFEQWALNLPGIKDMSGGAEKAGLGAAEVIKGITQAVREAVEAGFDLADAVTDAIAKFKKTAPEIIEAITEDKILQRFGVEKELFSAKNESTKKFREKYGIPEDVEVTAQVRRDHKMVIESAKALRYKGVNPLELADRVITERYMLTPEEQHLMLENEIALDNERRDIEKKIEKIDPEQIKRDDIAKMFTRLEEIRFEQSMMFTALERAGTEQSLVFRMRQLALNRAYSVEGFKRSYKAVRGEEAPQALVDKVQKQADIIRESQERIKELEPTLREQQMQEIIESLQEQLEREKKKPSSSLSKEKQARKTELKKKFAGMFNDATNIPALLADKEFIEYAGLVLEETARDFAKFAKKLVEEMGPKIEPHAKEIYDAISKRSFEKAYIKDGRIRIDKNLLLSVVEGGVKDHKDFLQKVYDIVKEDLPDVTEREVADAVSGYGKIIDSKLTDLERELNSIKRDLKLASGLEDVRAGKGVLRSGFQPPKPTDEQRRVMREIREEMKNYPEDEAQVQKKWTTALGKIKQTLENSIKDTQKRMDDLKAGIPVEKTERKRVQLDEKATQLREQLDDLKAQLKELEGPKTLSDEQLVKNAIAAAEKSEREYNRRTSEIRSTGAYTPTIKRTVSSPELDMARNARDRAKEDFDRALATTDYAKQAATQKALASAEEALAKLENKIARGDLSYRQKVMSMVDQTNPLLVAAKEKIKLQNNILKAMREASGEAERHMQEIWTKRKENSIKEIEQKIANKDYTKKIRKETPLTEEMIRLKAKEDRAKFTFEVAMEKARLEARPSYQKWADMVLELGSVPKSITASMDLSAVLRQGAILSARHPIVALTKAFPEMFKHMNKEIADKWHNDLVNSDEYIIAQRSGLFINEPNAKLAAREEQFASRLADFIPGTAASNRAYSAYLNVMRMEAFNKFRNSLLQNGYKGAELQKELTNYATFVNNATGRGKLPKFGKIDLEMAAPALNSFLFSPRFLASRVRMMSNIATGFPTSSPRARIEAYKAVGSYALAATATLKLLEMNGATVGLDPRSSDFGKAKIGDTTYDLWAGLQQPTVLMSKLLSGKYVSKGVEKEIGEGRNMTYKDLVEKFIRSKASPVAGAIYDAGVGRFPDYTPFDVAKLPERMLTPMLFQDLREMYGKENIGLGGVKWSPEGAALAASNVVPMMLGVGVQYMEPSEIIEKSNLRPRVENLVKKHKYQPKNNYDRDYYLDGKKMEVTDEQMEKIEKLRLKYAGEMINRADFDGLTAEAFDKKMDGFYNKALRKAQKEVLGNKAKQRE